MKPIIRPKRIVELNICGTLRLEMTETLEHLYDEFCEKERVYFEEDGDAGDYCRYAEANERLHEEILAEARRRYPKLDITELADYCEEEN